METLTKLNVFFVIAVLMSGLMYDVADGKESQQATDTMESKKIIQIWQVEATIPEGWEEIDRKRAKISNRKEYDVFVLMTDGVNDQIVWFEKVGRHWKMSIIENIPSQSHIRSKYDIKKLMLNAQNNRISYGKEGTEPISFFEWDPTHKIFLRYVPFAE